MDSYKTMSQVLRRAELDSVGRVNGVNICFAWV